MTSYKTCRRKHGKFLTVICLDISFDKNVPGSSQLAEADFPATASRVNFILMCLLLVSVVSSCNVIITVLKSLGMSQRMGVFICPFFIYCLYTEDDMHFVLSLLKCKKKKNLDNYQIHYSLLNNVISFVEIRLFCICYNVIFPPHKRLSIHW